MGKQDSYKKLFSNTIIITIGSFSSKLLILFLVPIYTNVLTDSQLGTTDFIIQIANWLIPIVTMSMSDAILRYGLDKAYDKAQVFTIGNILCLIGIIGLAILTPLAAASATIRHYIGSYSFLLFVYVMTSSIKMIYSDFTRALDRVKLFAFNGLLTTILTLGFTILFLVGFDMGITGYLLAIILSDACSIVFLMLSAKLWRYIKPVLFDRSLAAEILRYTVPLIPTQLLWLMINLANSYFTVHYLGAGQNGILAAAQKIPNIVASVYTMFWQAWNMSAITEHNSENRERFYSNVFAVNQAIMYLVAAVVMVFVKPVTQLWIGSDFRDAVYYSPILIFSTMYMCFNAFLGTVYVATKRSKRSLVTSLIAAVVCLATSPFFIQTFGLYGAALSSVASFGVSFLVRLIDARKLIHFDISVFRLITNGILIAAMTAANFLHGAWSYAILAILFFIVLALNYKYLIKMAKVLLPARWQTRLPFVK